MAVGRTHLLQELAGLEVAMLDMGELVTGMVGSAIQALVHRDVALAQDVVGQDDAVDAIYLDVDRRLIDLLATQAPVAADLRLLSAILHMNPHLERIGDQAVNVAKMALRVGHLPRSETIVAHLEEMGTLVQATLRTAMDGFARRDLERCMRLMPMDDPVDRLNREMYRLVIPLAADGAALEWGIMMIVVARQLERVGDNAVDIGEQVAFLLTGHFREFTDASHDNPADPELGRPFPSGAAPA